MAAIGRSLPPLSTVRTAQHVCSGYHAAKIHVSKVAVGVPAG